MEIWIFIGPPLGSVAAQFEQYHIPLFNILFKNKLKGKFHTCFLFGELTGYCVKSSPHMLSLPLLSTVQMLGKQITGILEPARGMENTEAIEPVMLMPTLKPGLHFAVQKRLPV